MKLYAVSDGPPSLAVRMALKALNIKFDHINVDFGAGEHMTDSYAKVSLKMKIFKVQRLSQKSKFCICFFQMNPQKEIPVLEDDGFYLSESNAILQVIIIS